MLRITEYKEFPGVYKLEKNGVVVYTGSKTECKRYAFRVRK